MDFAYDDDDDDDGGDVCEEWIETGELVPAEEVDFLFGSNDLLNSSAGAFHAVAQKQVWKDLSALSARLKEELGLSNRWDAVLLLRQFSWSIDKLHESYFNNVAKWRDAAGVARGRRSQAKRKSDASGAAEVDCQTCFVPYPPASMFSLKCGHGPYCKDCWSEHVHTLATTGAAAEIAAPPCMGPGCKLRLNYSAVRKLAQPADLARHKYFIVKEFVEGSSSLSFCPSPQCEKVLKFSGDGRPMTCARCECGARFCFACGAEDHNPITCTQLLKWSERNLDDMESVRLVTATTKACFHCGIPTERVDGCNHMQCKSCGGHWCWMCRGDWKTHGPHTGGFYSCNKYEASSAKKADLEAQKIKEDVDRYLHYFNGYFNHDQKKHSTPNMRETVERKAQKYRELSNGSGEFFKEAIDLLLRCRHILKYTYVYGFYLPDGSKGKAFFEYLQANAEGITERLADSIAAPMPKDAQELSRHVATFKDRLRYTKTYINNLVRGIEDGLGVEGLGTMESGKGKK